VNLPLQLCFAESSIANNPIENGQTHNFQVESGLANRMAKSTQAFFCACQPPFAPVKVKSHLKQGQKEGNRHHQGLDFVVGDLIVMGSLAKQQQNDEV